MVEFNEQELKLQWMEIIDKSDDVDCRLRLNSTEISTCTNFVFHFSYGKQTTQSEHTNEGVTRKKLND